MLNTTEPFTSRILLLTQVILMPVRVQPVGSGNTAVTPVGKVYSTFAFAALAGPRF